MSLSARRQELPPWLLSRDGAFFCLDRSDIADRAVDAPGVLHNTYYTELNPAGAVAQRRLNHI
jgi:hypothetical protein